MPPEPPPNWDLVIGNWGPLGLMLLPTIIAIYVTVWPAVASLYSAYVIATVGPVAAGAAVRGIGLVFAGAIAAFLVVVALVAVLVLGVLVLWLAAGGVTVWAIRRAESGG